MTVDIYEAMAIADIISDHVTEPRELEGAMGRLKRAWPEFAWTYFQRDDGRGGRHRAIHIDTRNLPTKISGETESERLELEITKIVRCSRCGALPRPSLTGGTVCPNCGTLVHQPLPEKDSDDGPGYVGGPAGPFEG